MTSAGSGVLVLNTRLVVALSLVAVTLLARPSVLLSLGEVILCVVAAAAGRAEVLS